MENGEDSHKDTYDPEEYWDSRAASGKENAHHAVCVKNASGAENKTAENVQLATLARIFSSYNLDGKSALEFGCGIGRLAPWFMKKGLRYTGVDLSGNMISAAKERLPDCGFHKLTNHEIPFPPGTFDLVYTVTVIHHNKHEDQPKIINELLRVTKPGGLILLMEDLDTGCSSFNMFPNTLEKWIGLVEKDGAARLVSKKLVRIWITRDLFRKAFKIFRGSAYSDESFRENRLTKIFVRIGVHLDAWLTLLIPERHAMAAAMLFKKSDKT